MHMYTVGYIDVFKACAERDQSMSNTQLKNVERIHVHNIYDTCPRTFVSDDRSKIKKHCICCLCIVYLLQMSTPVDHDYQALF